MKDNATSRRSLRETEHILESIANLIYLTRLEADHPARVREYMELSEERVNAMVKVLRRDVPMLSSTSIPTQC